MPKVIGRPSIGVTLTEAQLDALSQLHDAGVGVFVWMRLQRKTHLKFMLEGWVMYSAPKRNSTDLAKLKSQPPAHYALTRQGEAVYQAFQVGYKRNDNVCPRCGERQRMEGKGYCRPCANELGRAQRKEIKPGLCACGNPRQQSSTGRYYHQCEDCQKAHTKRRHADTHQARLDAQAAGSPLLCSICKERPCYISPSGRSSRSTCPICYKQYSRKACADYHRKVRARRLARRLSARLETYHGHLSNNHAS